MKEKIKTLIVTPSQILADGLKAVLEKSEFSVEETSASVPDRTGALLVIIDPMVANYGSAFNLGVTVAAIMHAAYDKESFFPFAAVISIYDSAPVILRKLRKAVPPVSEGGEPSDGGELSPREKEILVCVAKGMLNKEIAYKYGLSIFTVMTHRRNISAKTGIKSIAGLTAYAILQGLLDIEDIK